MKSRIAAFFILLCVAPPAWGLDVAIINQYSVTPFQLVSAAPYDRQEVSPAPGDYVLRFSQPVRPDRSSVKILDMYGHRVNDEMLDSDGYTLVTKLPPLAPGRYTARWMAECQCPAGITLGETFHFTVK